MNDIVPVVYPTSKHRPVDVDEGRQGLGGTQYIFRFPNGYGASMVVWRSVW